MRDSARTGWTGRLLRLPPAAAVVAAAMLSFAGRADASCGDYIVIVNPSDEARAAMHTKHHGQPHAPAAPRCDGPQCRSNRSRPAAPPAAPPPASAGGFHAALCTNNGSIDLTEPADALPILSAARYPSLPLGPDEKPPPTRG